MFPKFKTEASARKVREKYSNISGMKPRIRTWKLKDPEIANQFCVESAWSLLKKSLLEAAVMKIIEFVSLAIIVQWYFIVQKLVTHKSNLTVLETYQM